MVSCIFVSFVVVPHAPYMEGVTTKSTKGTKGCDHGPYCLPDLLHDALWGRNGCELFGYGDDAQELFDGGPLDLSFEGAGVELLHPCALGWCQFSLQQFLHVLSCRGNLLLQAPFRRFSTRILVSRKVLKIQHPDNPRQCFSLEKNHCRSRCFAAGEKVA